MKHHSKEYIALQSDMINEIQKAKSLDGISCRKPVLLMVTHLPLYLIEGYMATLQKTTQSLSNCSAVIKFIIKDNSISLERALSIIDGLDPLKYRFKFLNDGNMLSIKLSDRNKVIYGALFKLSYINKDNLIDECIDHKETSSSLIQWLIYNQKAFPIKTSNIRWYFVLRGATPKQTLDSLTPADAQITSRVLSCYFKKSKSKKATPLQYLSTCPEWQKPYALELI
jgi:hypothetical protein